MNARTEPTDDWPPDGDVAHLRVPPHSVEAEQSILGALLLDNAAFDRIGDLVAEGDFYRHENRLAFAAISGLILVSKPADVVTVFERLRAIGKADDVGGLAYLGSLAQSVPSARNIRQYAEIVRDRSVLRKVIAAADELATMAFADKAARVVLDKASTIFGELERTGQRSAPREIAALVVEALDRYDALSRGERRSGVASGFADLDRILHGLQAGKLLCIGARPSIGKSSMVRSIAIHVAKTAPVLLLSQEMPQDEVADCVVSELGGIDNERLKTGELDTDDWSRLTIAADEASRMQLHVDEQGALTLGDIRAKARGIKGLGLLIVDYLQLCSSTLQGKTTNDEIAQITKGLKALALEMRIPVLMLSQLNRKVEERGDREPQLGDLRDSGAIEQDIDVALFLWSVEETAASRVIGFKIAKHRGGPKGKFAMRFDAAFYRWTPCDFPPRAPKKGGDL